MSNWQYVFGWVYESILPPPPPQKEASFLKAGCKDWLMGEKGKEDENY